MFEYVTKVGEKLNILTPFDIKFTDIKTETIAKDDYVINRSEYPNGFTFESEVYSDKIIFRCNRKLIDNGDGTFTAPAD
jgi:hypothetical protein